MTHSTPATISVIIPTQNEEQLIGHSIRYLQDHGVHQVIVVDGQSNDQTTRIARSHGVTVLSSPPGRGAQMNHGAAVATGDILLFLHADTILPPAFCEQIRQALARPGVAAGAFRLRINSPQYLFRLIEHMVYWRCRLKQTPYGDQALFLRSDVFHRIGCYRQLPIMEDFDLVCRLRHVGHIQLTHTAAVTSARRWLKHGILQTTIANQLHLLAYRCGINPNTIAAWRNI